MNRKKYRKVLLIILMNRKVKASVVEFIDEKEGKVQESTVKGTAETSSSS